MNIAKLHNTRQLKTYHLKLKTSLVTGH